MSHVFSLSMSRAAFAKSDKFTFAAFIYPTAWGDHSHGNHDELLPEVSDCPHESSYGGCCPSPDPLCCETLRRCGLGPLSPHPGTSGVSRVDLRSPVLTERCLLSTYPAPKLF